MPSKGIDFYGFVAKGYEIEIRKANAGEKDHPEVSSMKTDKAIENHFRHYEIDTNLLRLRYEGKFQFVAKKDGRQLFERSIRVNGETGNIDSEDLRNILIASLVEEGFSLSFGLYDADSSRPNAHQLYACLTPNRRTWQADFFKRVDKHALKLRNMVLPGSHDAGMYEHLFHEASSMANTQKDNAERQLSLGARYFDYRPAAIHRNLHVLVDAAATDMKIFLLLVVAFMATGLIVVGLPVLLTIRGKLAQLASYLHPKIGEVCHVHAVIPGASFNNFFGDILRFLTQHKEEIVVVKLEHSGFMRDFNIPDKKVSDILPQALSPIIPNDVWNFNFKNLQLNGVTIKDGNIQLLDVPSKADLIALFQKLPNPDKIQIGDKSTLDLSIHEVLTSNKRLVIFFPEDNVSANDTYSDQYESYDHDVITRRLNECLDKPVGNEDFVKLQLQLTPTGTQAGILRALKGTNQCTSPLYATKPNADRHSYQLLLEKAQSVKAQGKLVAMQNDFYDNALTEVAIVLNHVNAGLPNP